MVRWHHVISWGWPAFYLYLMTGPGHSQLTVTLLRLILRSVSRPGRNILIKISIDVCSSPCVCCRHKIHHRPKKGLSSRAGSRTHGGQKVQYKSLLTRHDTSGTRWSYITIIRPPPSVCSSLSLASDLFINPVCLMLETLNKLVCVEFRI